MKKLFQAQPKPQNDPRQKKISKKSSIPSIESSKFRMINQVMYQTHSQQMQNYFKERTNDFIEVQ